MNPKSLVGDDDDSLSLTLSLCINNTPAPAPAPAPASNPYNSTVNDQIPSRVIRRRRGRLRQQPYNKPIVIQKSETIPQPYPWATTRRATIHSLRDLRAMDITHITGLLHCMRCGRGFEMSYDLREKLAELDMFMMIHWPRMSTRAPEEWMNPTLPDCPLCKQTNCAKPVSPTKMKNINWLFLLLGQIVGCCKLSELKYFCKHTKLHRTGAKDRVLYLTYQELCRQLSR